MIAGATVMRNTYIPDVTAFPLEEALQLLEKNGVNYYVKKTAPLFSSSRKSKAANEVKKALLYRVIRQREDNTGIIELVIAPEAAFL